MKRGNTLLFLLILIVSLLFGCNKVTDQVFDEVKLQGLNNDVKSFISNIQDRNGLYLYSPINDDQYVIVMYINVVQGEAAKYLNSINGKITNGSMILNIEELVTQDYEDKKINGIRIFKIKNEHSYDRIQIFKNGEETKFDLVGG